jgi:hypothetical protein
MSVFSMFTDKNIGYLENSLAIKHPSHWIFLSPDNNRADTGQAGLEAVFQVPMPGDSGSSLDAGIISNYFDLGDFSLKPQRNPYPTLTPPSC